MPVILPVPSLSAPEKQIWLFVEPVCLKRPSLHVSAELKQHVDSEMHILKEKKKKERHRDVTWRGKGQEVQCVLVFKVQSVLHHCEND